MKQSRTRQLLLSGFLCVGLASGFTAAQANAQTKKQDAEKVLPSLCGGQHEVRFVVDVNSTSANAQLQLCPQGNQKTVQATLTAGDFTSRMTKLNLGAGVVFSRDKASGSALDLDPIPPGELRTVKAEISNLWEAGEAEAPLRVNGVEVGKLVAVKYRLPFGVRVEAPDPAKPEITFQLGQPQEIVLVNDDPVTYYIEWGFQVAGIPYQGTTILTPKSTAKFAITPDAKWFRGFTGLLKDSDQDRKLTLSFRPPGVEGVTYWPSKVVTVKFHLRYASDAVRSWATNILVVLVLLLGALFSFTGSVGLPNRIERARLRDRLKELGRRTGRVSRRVDSRLRVLVSVERMRLLELLKSRWSLSADMVRVLDEVRTAVQALETQQRLLERVDALQARLAALKHAALPPRWLDDLLEKIWKAADIINQAHPTEEQLRQADQLLVEAENRAAELEAPALSLPDDQAKVANQQLANLTADRKVSKDMEDLPEPSKTSLKKLYDELISEPPLAAGTATVHDYARLDHIIGRIGLIRDFLKIYRESSPEYRTRLEDELLRLMKSLGLDSWDALRHARGIVQQMREGVFPSDFFEALSADRLKAEIDVGPDLVRANERVQFRVRFFDPRLDQAIAREDLQATWEFGHQGLHEVGWEVSHYFPGRSMWRRFLGWPKGRKFSERLRDGFLGQWRPMIVFTLFNPEAASGPVSERLSRELIVQSDWRLFGLRSDRNRAELLRGVVTLVPVIFGLVAGAKDQLLKMDVPSAVMTIFLLGFGSDTVKNLVSQSQQTPSALPAPPAAAATATGGGVTSTAASGKTSR
jgi:hypothetical protein